MLSRKKKISINILINMFAHPRNIFCTKVPSFARFQYLRIFLIFSLPAFLTPKLSSFLCLTICDTIGSN